MRQQTVPSMHSKGKPVKDSEMKKQGAALILLSTDYGPEITNAIPHVRYFPERSLAYMHLARDYERVIIVLPEAISEVALEYFIDTFFRPTERAEFEAKITVLAVPNGTEGVLARHFIDDDQCMAELRSAIGDNSPLKIINAVAYPYDDKLSSILEATLEEAEIDVARKFGSKFGSKSLFNWACVDQPDWRPGKHIEKQDVLSAMLNLFERHPKICVKIDDYAMAGGIGNFYFCRPSPNVQMDTDNIADYLIDSTQSFSEFWKLVERSGCIVEAFIEDIAAFPSALMSISEEGWQMESWQHQYIQGSHFSGFLIAPSPLLEVKIRQFSDHISETAYQMGYRGSLGIDFIETKSEKLMALELNSRKTGVSHVIQFCDGILRKHRRVRDEATFITYRRGIFAESSETRLFENNLTRLAKINSVISGRSGDGCYFINVNSLRQNGFVEYVCIASNQDQIDYMEREIQNIFVPDTESTTDCNEACLWNTLGTAI